MVKISKQAKAELQDTFFSYCEAESILDNVAQEALDAVLKEKMTIYQEELVRDALKQDDLGLVQNNLELKKLFEVLDTACYARTSGMVIH